MDQKPPAAGKAGPDAPEKQKDARKGRVLLFFLILVGLLAVLIGIDLLIGSGGLASLFSADRPETAKRVTDLWPVDYDEDIMTDEGYLGLNRYIRYADGGYATYLASERDLAAASPAAAFFRAYFDAVIAGDAEAYNACFTDEYRRQNGEKGRFTAQKIYDIEVEKLVEYRLNEDTPEEILVWEFDVSYRIRQNNGTFRDDIESDTARKQVYQLYQPVRTGEVLIQMISEYRIKR